MGFVLSFPCPRTSREKLVFLKRPYTDRLDGKEPTSAQKLEVSGLLGGLSPAISLKEYDTELRKPVGLTDSPTFETVLRELCKALVASEQSGATAAEVVAARALAAALSPVKLPAEEKGDLAAFRQAHALTWALAITIFGQGNARGVAAERIRCAAANEQAPGAGAKRSLPAADTQPASLAQSPAVSQTQPDLRPSVPIDAAVRPAAPAGVQAMQLADGRIVLINLADGSVVNVAPMGPALGVSPITTMPPPSPAVGPSTPALMAPVARSPIASLGLTPDATAPDVAPGGAAPSGATPGGAFNLLALGRAGDGEDDDDDDDQGEEDYEGMCEPLGNDELALQAFAALTGRTVCVHRAASGCEEDSQ